MDSYDIDRLKHLSNTEVVRRLLIQYFIAKGFKESFNRQIYPSLIQDLTLVLPVLNEKIEIVPHAIDINTSTGKAILGWNLFVLGSQRMYLGETYHNDLHSLARQIRSGIIPIPTESYSTARRQTTPKKIITFITRVLSNNSYGYIDLNPSRQPARPVGEPFAARNSMAGMPQQFFNRTPSI